MRPRPALRTVSLLLAFLWLAAVPALRGAQPGLAAVAARQDGAGESAASEVLIQASIVEAPTAPAVLRLVRTTIQPGSSVPLHSHPGPLVGHVESGTLTVPVEGGVPITDAQPEGTPAAADGATVLSRGDQFVVPTGTVFAYRNDGTEPVTFVNAVLVPVGEDQPPSVAWPAGTPAAEELAGVFSRSLGTGALPVLPGGPLEITLDRLALAPGVAIPAREWPVLLSVEIGTFAFALVEGNVQIALAREPNQLRFVDTAGTQIALGPGDAVLFPQGMAEIARSEQQGILVLLRLSILGTELASPVPGATPIPGSEQQPSVGTPQIAPGSTVTVTAAGVGLRASPSVSGNLVVELLQGQVLEVTGDSVDAEGIVWWPVRDPATAFTGYVPAEYLAPVE